MTLTEGDYENYKITTQDDLQKERTMRIGHGYDVHRLVEGRKLILGGVEIPYEKGLLGHSDADVLLHAVMDAVLARRRWGHRQHFPDSDPAYKGADSLALTRAVAGLVAENGYRVGNIDATILCQAPKLAPHIAAMRQNIAGAFGIDIGAVSVKATTEERLVLPARGRALRPTPSPCWKTDRNATITGKGRPGGYAAKPNDLGDRQYAARVRSDIRHAGYPDHIVRLLPAHPVRAQIARRAAGARHLFDLDLLWPGLPAGPAHRDLGAQQRAHHRF